jgi:hypothetical protein
MKSLTELNDFGYYYIATKMLLCNGNPYNLSEFISLQNAYNIDLQHTVQFNYPPWSLNWFLLFAITNPLLGFKIWKIFNVFVLILSTLIGYDIIRKSQDTLLERFFKQAFASLAIVFFAYADFLWSNSNFLALFGLLLYFRYTYQFENSKIASLGLSLIIIKPNLLLAFISYAFFCAVKKRDKIFISYFICSICLQLAIPAIINPTIYTNYIQNLSHIVQESYDYAGFSLAQVLKYYLPFRLLSFALILFSVVLGMFVALRFERKIALCLLFIPVSLLLSPHTMFTSALLMFPCIVFKLNSINKGYLCLNLLLFAIAILSSTLAKDINIIMLSFYFLMLLAVHQVLIFRYKINT